MLRSASDGAVAGGLPAGASSCGAAGGPGGRSESRVEQRRRRGRRRGGGRARHGLCEALDRLGRRAERRGTGEVVDRLRRRLRSPGRGAAGARSRSPATGPPRARAPAPRWPRVRSRGSDGMEGSGSGAGSTWICGTASSGRGGLVAGSSSGAGSWPSGSCDPTLSTGLPGCSSARRRVSGPAPRSPGRCRRLPAAPSRPPVRISCFPHLRGRARCRRRSVSVPRTAEPRPGRRITRGVPDLRAAPSRRAAGGCPATPSCARTPIAAGAPRIRGIPRSTAGGVGGSRHPLRYRRDVQRPRPSAGISQSAAQTAVSRARLTAQRAPLVGSDPTPYVSPAVWLHLLPALPRRCRSRLRTPVYRFRIRKGPGAFGPVFSRKLRLFRGAKAPERA